MSHITGAAALENKHSGFYSKWLCCFTLHRKIGSFPHTLQSACNNNNNNNNSNNNNNTSLQTR